MLVSMIAIVIIQLLCLCLDAEQQSVSYTSYSMCKSKSIYMGGGLVANYYWSEHCQPARPCAIHL